MKITELVEEDSIILADPLTYTTCRAFGTLWSRRNKFCFEVARSSLAFPTTVQCFFLQGAADL